MSRLLIEKAEIEARLLKSNPDTARFLYHGTSFPGRLPMLRPSFSQTMPHAEQGALAARWKVFTITAKIIFKEKIA